MMKITHQPNKKQFNYKSMAILDLLQTIVLDRPRIMDSLTGVSTIFHIENIGNKMLKSGSVTAVVLGIDEFKELNDSYGHLIANNLLIEFGKMLQQKTQGCNGIVGRLGGDEFVILMDNCCSSKQGCSTTECISNKIIDETYKIDPNIEPIKIRVSVGEATIDKDSGYSIRELLQKAEADMDYNKYKNRANISKNIRFTNVFNNQANYLLKVLAEKDMYTYVHSQYTAKCAVEIAEELGLSNDMIEKIYFAGWAHDIGKIVVTSEILRKPSKLDNGEYNIIKSHVVNGLNIIIPYDFDETVKNAINYHHERWDGKGYPNGVLGEDTPIEGRIMQVADAFSAMTIKRVYRERMSVEGSLEEIEKNSGSQFDPKIAKTFVKLMKKREMAI